MFEIEYYEDERGNSEIRSFLLDLKEKSRSSKSARINFDKIVAYLDSLETLGTQVGYPVVRHLDGEIWELRPLSNRILFAYFKEGKIILLQHFVKKTQKTPRREIEKAKKKIDDYRRRYDL